MSKQYWDLRFFFYTLGRTAPIIPPLPSRFISKLSVQFGGNLADGIFIFYNIISRRAARETVTVGCESKLYILRDLLLRTGILFFLIMPLDTKGSFLFTI